MDYISKIIDGDSEINIWDSRIQGGSEDNSILTYKDDSYVFIKPVSVDSQNGVTYDGSTYKYVHPEFFSSGTGKTYGQDSLIPVITVGEDGHISNITEVELPIRAVTVENHKVIIG